MKLIAGLGNPGKDYATTRHNVGFLVADLLADRAGAPTWSRKFKARVTTGTVGGERALILKPQTYMNLSGESVQPAAAFYRVHPSEIVVVHDDIDFEFGRIAVKQGGGHGGHKGLRSIAAHLGPEFVRVRLGVGRPRHGDVSNYVLGGFRPEERSDLDAMLARAADAVEVVLREGVKAAQNRFNAWPLPTSTEP